MLALDTATDGVAVALHDGQRVLHSTRAGDARHHNEVLVTTIAEVLAAAGRDRADITDIAVGVGPGPFTGLRVGIVTARMLGLAWSVPVHGVCSLDALAAQAVAERVVAPDTEFLVAGDARRREVHTARYLAAAHGADQGLRRLSGPVVGSAGDVGASGEPVVGRGAQLYPQALGPGLAPFVVDAGWLAQVAVDALTGRGQLPILPVEPLYLRRPDATEPGARKRVTA